MFQAIKKIFKINLSITVKLDYVGDAMKRPKLIPVKFYMFENHENCEWCELDEKRQ